jgi:hypothetical protein
MQISNRDRSKQAKMQNVASLGYCTTCARASISSFTIYCRDLVLELVCSSYMCAGVKDGLVAVSIRLRAATVVPDSAA